MIEILPNWHPVLVHFTVALFLAAALLFFAAGALPGRLTSCCIALKLMNFIIPGPSSRILLNLVLYSLCSAHATNLSSGS